MPAWFNEFVNSIDSGDQWYLACEDCGAGMLPPREICTSCGSTRLESEPLSNKGTIVSFTEISITIPKFQEETPYTVLLVDLGNDITLTGQLRAASSEDVNIGDTVKLGTEPRENGVPLLTFQPLRD